MRDSVCAGGVGYGFGGYGSGWVGWVCSGAGEVAALAVALAACQVPTSLMPSPLVWPAFVSSPKL